MYNKKICWTTQESDDFLVSQKDWIREVLVPYLFIFGFQVILQKNLPFVNFLNSTYKQLS